MLVNCVAYQNGERVAELPLDDIRSYLKGPGSFVWVALKDPDEPELHLVQEKFSLHDLAVEDASHGHQRPKMDEYGLVALHRPARGRAPWRRSLAGRSGDLRRSRLHRLGEAQRRARLRRRAAPLRAGAGAAAARARVRPVCIDGRGGRPILPRARGPRRRGRVHRGADLQGPEHAGADRGAVRPPPQADASRPGHRPASRSDRQAPRRACAAHLLRAARLLP